MITPGLPVTWLRATIQCLAVDNSPLIGDRRMFAVLGRLAMLVILCLPFGTAHSAERSPFPQDASVLNVRRDYGAKGDGVTDDTEALQKAINENVGRHRLLCFPDGTYLVSSTLKWPKRFGDRDNWGFTYLCGESCDSSVIRLKDATFTDATHPEPMMWGGGFGSADGFTTMSRT